MDPILFTLGPLTIAWHGLFSAIGVLVGVTLVAYLAKKSKVVTEDDIYSMALWVVPGGIIGARLLFVIEKLDYFITNPLTALAINEGGLSIYGGVLGGTIVGLIYARVKRLPIGGLTDIIPPGLILGQITGRIGDIINGEHHGTETDLPWGFVYTHPNTQGELGLQVHPAIGYEMVWNLLVFALLWRWQGRFERKGTIFPIYLIGYSLGRFLTGFVRKDVIIAVGLTQAQLVAIGLIVIGVACLVYLYRQKTAVRQVAPSRGSRR